jgi:DMSO reductase family type II enzyme heme b subunit
VVSSRVRGRAPCTLMPVLANANSPPMARKALAPRPRRLLVAEGPGTLSPAPATTSRGRGIRTENGWIVVVTRRLPDGLGPRARTQVAFAVWEGSAEESGSRKMRTGWVGLSMREAP